MSSVEPPLIEHPAQTGRENSPRPPDSRTLTTFRNLTVVVAAAAGLLRAFMAGVFISTPRGTSSPSISTALYLTSAAAFVLYAVVTAVDVADQSRRSDSSWNRVVGVVQVVALLNAVVVIWLDVHRLAN